MRLLSVTSLCLGEQIPDQNVEKGFQLSVSGSRVANITSNNSTVQVKRLISLSCLLLVSGCSSCTNCQYAYKLWKKREGTRKRAKMSVAFPNKRNERYMARDGLEEKLTTQRKRHKSDGKREKAKEDEMLNFVEEDNLDLIRIIEDIDKDKIPADMKLLWEMQMKQLAAKSAKGYRWHPRFVLIIYICIYILYYNTGLKGPKCI